MTTLITAAKETSLQRALELDDGATRQLCDITGCITVNTFVLCRKLRRGRQ